tara:strand:+ start:398 stop:910 length:513 start_codon:yes stop_codon:yes gene_type:complete
MAVKQLIQTVTVGAGGAASIEFAGIDQTGVDLALLLSTRQDAFAHNQIIMRFNSDSGSNYSFVELTGSGSSASSDSASTTSARIKAASPGPSETANTFGSSNVLISNYTSSSAKSISSDSVTENNATAAYQSMTANTWTGTTAITTITLTGDGANFVEHSTASLFKIKYD